MGESGYRSESCCCAELRHRCHCRCLLLPPGQMATGLMSRDDELAHHLLPSVRVHWINSPSIICACTEAASSKDWWEFPELSASQSNMAALPQEESAGEWKQRGKNIQFLIWDAPKWATAAVLPGCHVARSCQGEDALPGSRSSIGWLVNRDLLTGGGGLFWRGTPKR